MRLASGVLGGRWSWASAGGWPQGVSTKGSGRGWPLGTLHSGVHRPEAGRSQRAERCLGTAAAESEALRRRGGGPGLHTEHPPWARPPRPRWGRGPLHAVVQPGLEMADSASDPVFWGCWEMLLLRLVGAQ